MSNVIQIKHGASAPADGVLAPYELGYDSANNELYIGIPKEDGSTTSLKISTKESDDEGGGEGLYCWYKFNIKENYTHEMITEELGTTKPSDLGGLPYYSGISLTEDGHFSFSDATTSPSSTGTYYLLPSGVSNPSEATYVYKRYIVWSDGTGSTNYAKISIKTTKNENKLFQSYVVSNELDSYPNDGQKGEYWYIRFTNS